MLYDPKWAKPSMESFIAWLATKPPRARYDFNNCQGECLLGQYMAAMGIEWGKTPDQVSGSWAGTNYIATGKAIFGRDGFHILGDKPWTFGSALKRAKQFDAR